MKKDTVENLLKVNGLGPTAKDEEVRSVLLSANYKEDEIDAAVMVMRENTKTKKTRLDGLHKVFRSDETLNPSEISTLLGIDVKINEPIITRDTDRMTKTSRSMVILFALLLGFSAVLLYMSVMQIGLFHPSSAIAITFLK